MYGRIPPRSERKSTTYAVSMTTHNNVAKRRDYRIQRVPEPQLYCLYRYLRMYKIQIVFAMNSTSLEQQLTLNFISDNVAYKLY